MVLISESSGSELVAGLLRRHKAPSSRAFVMREIKFFFFKECLLFLLSSPPHRPSVKIARCRPELRKLRCNRINVHVDECEYVNEISRSDSARER